MKINLRAGRRLGRYNRASVKKNVKVKVRFVLDNRKPWTYDWLSFPRDFGPWLGTGLEFGGAKHQQRMQKVAK